jgi:DNA-binding CsgD family transcriptional regulator
MTARLSVTERDLRSLLDIVNADRDDSAATALPSSLLIDLMGLVRCEGVTFAGLDSTQMVTWAVQGQPTAEFLRNPDTFWGPNYWNCESCSYPSRSGDLRSVTKISDFYSVRQWHATGHYADNARPAGLEHKLQVCLPAAPASVGPAKVMQLAFWRQRGPDFSERDRALLALLRPHLHQVYLDAAARRHGIPRLTPRQRELLQLVAAGHDNAAIAHHLGLSRGTVRKHLENIYARLGVSSRTAAVARAFPVTDRA